MFFLQNQLPLYRLLNFFTWCQDFGDFVVFVVFVDNTLEKFVVDSDLTLVLPIRITSVVIRIQHATSMRIRIQHFTSMQIWIRLFTLIRVLLFINLMRICDHWSTDPDPQTCLVRL
jgi:hypothetical protein